MARLIVEILIRQVFISLWKLQVELLELGWWELWSLLIKGMRITVICNYNGNVITFSSNCETLFYLDKVKKLLAPTKYKTLQIVGLHLYTINIWCNSLLLKAYIFVSYVLLNTWLKMLIIVTLLFQLLYSAVKKI